MGALQGCWEIQGPAGSCTFDVMNVSAMSTDITDPPTGVNLARRMMTWRSSPRRPMFPQRRRCLSTGLLYHGDTGPPHHAGMARSAWTLTSSTSSIAKILFGVEPFLK